MQSPSPLKTESGDDAAADTPDASGRSGGGRRIRWSKLAPLLVVLAGLALIFATGLNRYLSLEMLEAKRVQLQAMVRLHPVLSVLTYAGVYVAVVAFSLPGAMIMTMTGGFLFGPFLGSAAAVIGASTGAVLMFLVARTALGDILRRRAQAGGMVEKIQQGIRENAVSYMLVMRLVPAIPFWLVNIAAGCVRIPLRTYVAATVVGIIPSTLIYSSIGSGLGHVFDRGETPDLKLLFDPRIYLPLFGLAFLSIAPLLVHGWRARRRRIAAADPAE